MFAYCNNNPIIYSDSSGQIIKLAEDATEWEKEQYARAVAYISKSEVGRALIEKIESSDVVFTIVFVDNSKTEFLYDQKIIHFDANCGTLLKDGISVQSPALALAHEMGHAAQYLDGQLTAFMHSDNLGKQLLIPGIEEQNLQMHEIPIAKQLGEPIRNSYDDGIQAKIMNNSTHYITKGTRPWWHYTFTWNLFKPRTFAEHHNTE